MKDGMAHSCLFLISYIYTLERYSGNIGRNCLNPKQLEKQQIVFESILTMPHKDDK